MRLISRRLVYSSVMACLCATIISVGWVNTAMSELPASGEQQGSSVSTEPDFAIADTWLRGDHLTRFEKIPTIFGPVSVRFQLSDDGKTLNVQYCPDFQHAPSKVVVHVPPLAQIEEVNINGHGRVATAGDTFTISENAR